jgi:hypothetical protein
MFYEPMAAGHAVLAHTHRLLLSDPRAGEISADGRWFLENMAVAWEFVLDHDKSPERVVGFDDKWCFPRTVWEELALNAGFSSCRFLIPEPFVTFTAKTRQTIPLAIPGAGPEILPDWCWQAIGNLDRLCSGPLSRELACSAVLVLQAGD